MDCTLCGTETHRFYNHKTRVFYFCSNCFSILLCSKFYLNADCEKKHYELHKNNSSDPRYQKFVFPIVNSIIKNQSTKQNGLDFGSGKDSSISKLLTDSNFKMKEFDPFFKNEEKLIEDTYDFISCCEVMEHFHQPYKSFKLLKKLLKPKGKLYCMTELYSEKMNFDSWYYKNDPTHVFFYHPKTIKWIAENFGYKKYTIDNRLVVFEN